jgi:amino acid transporter
MDQVLRGMIVFGCVVIGLFFLRFYRRSSDRLFLFFALSFILLAAERFTLAVLASYEVPPSVTVGMHGDEPGDEAPTAARSPQRQRQPDWMTAVANVPYWVRAFAYLLIIAGIVDKNISGRRNEPLR